MIDISFEGFKGREEKLKEITRASLYDIMFYRTDVFLHSQKVYHLLNDIMPELKSAYGSSLDSKKAYALALVHDDAEIITGDHQLYHKRRMSKGQLAKLREDEIKAIETLANRWPDKINGYSYRDLLYNVMNKNCIEVQLVSFVDKIDGFCEYLHELHAGNDCRGGVQEYLDVLPTFPVKFPELAKLIPGEHPFCHVMPNIDMDKILANGKPHDKVSVWRDSGIPHYERWKAITNEHLEIEPLINKIE